jgi:multiple antibiotic resistance protein
MDFLNVLSAFMVLFAVIDIVGVLPIIADIKNSGKSVMPAKTSLIAAFILVGFFFGGEFILALFHVDFSAFAAAGSIVLFFLALEMILGYGFFKHEANADATIIPVAFPLIAGPGSITTLISLRAEYSPQELLAALAANLVVVYIVLRSATRLEKILGTTFSYIAKKFFGIILLAMAVKLFASNVGILFGNQC